MIYVATYYKIRTSKMGQNAASDLPESDDINSKVYAPRPLTEYQVPLTAELPLVTTYVPYSTKHLRDRQNFRG